jgi:hypothetical protein
MYHLYLFLKRALLYTYVIRIQKMHTFYINGLINSFIHVKCVHFLVLITYVLTSLALKNTQYTVSLCLSCDSQNKQ